jgi:hypothetical protein
MSSRGFRSAPPLKSSTKIPTGMMRMTRAGALLISQLSRITHCRECNRATYSSRIPHTHQSSIGYPIRGTENHGLHL